MAKQKYYSTDRIDSKDATYNVIFGERSNGKTFALLKKSLEEYFTGGGQFAYVRRWKEDITGRRASELFSGINAEGVVEELTDGQYTAIHYFSGKFYACNYGEDGKAIYSDSDIVGYAFALSNVEHDKSTSYPNVTSIVFDEFLTNRIYLNDEFVIFMNVVSTIARRREDVKIYMLGNTVNKYCPYFSEMGLVNILAQNQGDIDIYEFGKDSKLRVAVEYCSSTNRPDAKENKYFAFDNPKLEMITGGAWELSVYPHLPMKYKPKHVLITYFIKFSDQIFHCDVVAIDDVMFTYIHAKTTPIKNPDEHIIYDLEHNPSPNYVRSIYKPKKQVHKRILYFYKHDLVFFSNNTIGDAVNNYLNIAAGI